MQMHIKETRTAQVAWVTGASSGIGRATVLALADEGWLVAASARSADALEALAAERPGRIVAFPLDVTDAAAIDATITEIEARLGPMSLALLAAGTYMRDSALAFDTAAFRTMLDLNVMGTVQCLTAVAKVMATRKSGRIAVTSSVAAYTGLPGGGAYGATKAALNNLCEAFRPELEAAGITLQLVNPGFVETPLTAKNDFDMPFIISAEEAAKDIVKGLKTDRFEIIFPWRMALAIKLLHMLPYRLVFAITRRMVRRA